MGTGAVVETAQERKRRLQREAGQRWRAKQPRERLQEMHRRQNAKNRKKWSQMTPERQAQVRAAQNRWRCKTVGWTMLRQARARAKAQGLPCTITVADCTVPERCPVLGIPLERGKGKLHDGSPTLDRFVPLLGYVPGNVSVISHRANRIKQNASLVELEAVVKWMQNR